MTTLELTDLTAEWWRIEASVDNDPMTDDELSDLLSGQNPLVVDLAATPASNIQELSAKLRVLWEYHVPPGTKRSNGDRLFESILGDAERLAAANGPGPRAVN